MLLWNDNHIDLTDLMIGEFHITATVNLRESPNSFKLTTVYGPSRRARKHEYLKEIISIKQTIRFSPKSKINGGEHNI